MNISIIGTGHVGLVTGVCFSDVGNNVLCMDHDHQKVEILQKGQIPFYEPGLQELVRKNRSEKRLRFTSSMKEAISFSEVIFLCVGTPPKDTGEADLSALEHVANAIASYLSDYRLIVEKSTVPVETGQLLKEMIKNKLKKTIRFDVASNPEFLREGTAVHDFFSPDRIILGVDNDRARNVLTRLYKPFKVPIIVMDMKSAEMMKHASNTFLAMKISFINLVSQMCEKVGADISRVAEGMGSDRRINKSFLSPGIGFGGSCFPKDLAAFGHIAEKLNVSSALIREVQQINETQKAHFSGRIVKALNGVKGKRIAILGLAFKPNTDDLRNAPSIDIIQYLKERGAVITAFDPWAVKAARGVLRGIRYAKSAYAACKGSDCAVILTEWREFKELDLVKLKKILKKPFIFDGRNIYDPAFMQKHGFHYFSVGRTGGLK